MSFTGMNLSQALPRMMKKPCPKCGSHCLSFTCNRSNPEGMFNEFTITDEKGRKRTGNLAVLCCGCYSVMPIGEYLARMGYFMEINMTNRQVTLGKRSHQTHKAFSVIMNVQTAKVSHISKMALKYCNYPGCSELVTNGYCKRHSQRSRFCAFPRCSRNAIEGSNYCEEHQPKKMADKRRGSSRNRGYTPHWEKIRAVYLSHHPLCERCESLGVITPAVLVHHRIRLVEGGTNDNTNLMALCYRCHEAIHTEQNDYKKV